MLKIRKSLISLSPYIPGEQPQESGYIKLNTNENPFPPPKKIYDILKSFPLKKFSRYPSSLGEPLGSKLSQFWEIPKEWIFITNGADEALRLLSFIFLEKGRRGYFFSLSYSLYPVLIKMHEGELFPLPMKENLQMDLEALPKEEGILFFCNPNAPTGEWIPVKKLFSIVKENPQLFFIIDEAYADFTLDTPSSLIPYLRGLPNAVVVRTFSKGFSLASLRLGYIIAPQKEIQEILQKVKDSYNKDALSLEIGKYLLEEISYFKEIWKKVSSLREYLKKELEKRGFYVLPSYTNFLLVSPPKEEAFFLYKELKKKKILVRYFSSPPILEKFLRISIGKEEEIREFLHAIDEILLPGK